MLKRHRDGVLRFVKHPVTKGVAEGVNSKITRISRECVHISRTSSWRA